MLTDEQHNGLSLDNLFQHRGHSRCWDNAKLQTFVDQYDHDYIKRIYLSTRSKTDRLIWSYNFTGDYTVRSGYWLSTHDPSNTIPTMAKPHGSVDLKTKIWNLPIMPKLKHFLWRIMSKALPTTERLTTRGMRIDPGCPRCRRENESINHALFTCPFATMAWRLSDTPLYRSSILSNNIEDNISNILLLLQNTTITDSQKLIPFWLLWRIWKARNNVVLNNLRESPSITVVRAKAETNEWLNATQTQGPRRLPKRTTAAGNTTWVKPQMPYIKCNFDASFTVQDLKATGGWIIRNHNGTPEHWGSMVLDHTSTPIEAETKALLAALQQIWIRGYTHVIMEGDCQTLIQLVTNSASHCSLANLLTDIQFWAGKFRSIQFKFVKREGNMIAHDLAKLGCNSSCFYSDSGLFPSWLQKHHCNNTI